MAAYDRDGEGRKNGVNANKEFAFVAGGWKCYKIDYGEGRTTVNIMKTIELSAIGKLYGM